LKHNPDPDPEKLSEHRARACT